MTSAMDNELSRVALMIGTGADTNEPLEDILGHIEVTLLKESKDIAAEAGKLQLEACSADEKLQTKLGVQQETLTAVGERTDLVVREFDRALDGGLRIGERLAATEAARLQIQFAEDLLTYIKFFESCPRETTAAVLECRKEDLLTFLPARLRKQSWLDISNVFQSLRRILYDINMGEMEAKEQASFVFLQEVVIALSTAIEGVLLAIFEGQMMLALEHPEDDSMVAGTREVVAALMMFNDGAAMQKRYIFSVVARRFVPAAVSKKKSGIGSKLLQGLGDTFKTFKKAGAAVKRISTHKSGPGDDGDDSSSAGDEFDGAEEAEEQEEDRDRDGAAQKISDMIAFGRYGDAALQLERSASEMEEEGQGVFGSLLAKTLTFSRRQAGAGLGEDSSQIMDLMSRLFASLHQLFMEQIVVLRKVFPLLVAQKVIKMLLQRIFNDPAFGIQGRIDAVMRSGEQVSPSYYLDVLMIVREKLSAFFVMIVECTNYIGKAATEDASKSSTQPIDLSAKSAETAFALWNEEIRGFLEEQVYLMLQGYTKDYFQKELSFLKQQYCDILKNAATEDPTLLSKIGPNEPLPRLRPDKVKSVSILNCAVNTPLVHSILSVTSEAVARMGSIGRDDAALPLRARDVFLTLTSFLVDHILVPSGKAFKALLLKHASSRQFTSAPISTDFLLLISCLHNSFFRIKSNFESTFVPALMYENNELTVCRETNRKAMRSLDAISSECIHTWIETTAMYNERLLVNLQSRYDFSPRFENKRNAGIEPTAACKQLCLTLTNTVQFVKTHVAGEGGGRGASASEKNNLEAILWRELGQRLVATYLSHLRKSKISQEGAFILVRDLDEYYGVIDSMSCPEVLDMFVSMREMTYAFMAPVENIENMITDELRHLDTHILLCLLRARTDFSMRAAWVKQLKLLYPSFNKWDAPFAWETTDSQVKGDSGKRSTVRPPETLRKVSMAKSALLNPVSRTYGGPGGGTPIAQGPVSEAVVRAPPVKSGVYKMLRTAEESANRPSPVPVVAPTPVARPPTAPRAVKPPEKVESPQQADIRPQSTSKKPNMLERMASKFEDIIDSPSGNNPAASSTRTASVGNEKKKNVFGKLFGKGTGDDDSETTNRNSFFRR